MTESSGSPLNPLEVRIRKTVSEGGVVEQKLTVFCEGRGHSVAVEECLECERCEGLELAPSGAHVLRCQGMPEADGGRPTPTVRGPKERVWPSLAEQTPVSEVMTPNVICVEPTLTVRELTGLLLEKGVSGVPVVDADGYAIGVVTKTDLVRDYHEREEGGELTAIEGPSGYELELGPGFHTERINTATVNDIMTPISFGVPERASVSHAAALMGFEGVHRLPVLSTDNKVVGVISSLDILRWLANQDGYIVPPSKQQTRP